MTPKELKNAQKAYEAGRKFTPWKRSGKAGRKKGCVAWNKGKKKENL
jgi:hypothetical protein